MSARDNVTVSVQTPYSTDEFSNVTVHRSDLPGYLTVKRDGVEVAWYSGDWAVDFK